MVENGLGLSPDFIVLRVIVVIVLTGASVLLACVTIAGIVAEHFGLVVMLNG